MGCENGSRRFCDFGKILFFQQTGFAEIRQAGCGILIGAKEKREVKGSFFGSFFEKDERKGHFGVDNGVLLCKVHKFHRDFFLSRRRLE